MPVAAHREQYTGDGPLVVAYQLLEEENPVGYSADGQRIELDVRTPPSFPVLMIVPREDDLTPQAVGAECTNVAERAGAVGTWRCKDPVSKSVLPPNDGVRDAGAASASVSYELQPACEPMRAGEGAPETASLSDDCYVPPPPPPPAPGGLYLTSSYLSDMHEPWTRGEPEITYLVTTVPTFGNQFDTRVSCLSEAPLPTSAFYLDHNDNTQSFMLPTTGWTVEHMFLNRGQIQDMEAIAFSRGDSVADVNVTVWEDDTGGKCTLDEDNVIAKITGAVNAIGSIIGTVKGFGTCADEATDPSRATQIKTALKWFKSVSSVCGILKLPTNVRTVLAVFGGDDDFIGVSQQTPTPSSNSNNSHVIVANGGQVGRFYLSPQNQF